MKKKQFKVTIQAARNLVWFVLWNDETYTKWTSPFTEGVTSDGSKAVTDWNEGSEVQFVAGTDGMYSLIEKKDEPRYMAFKHLGEIKGGVKQAQSDWAGAMETYTLEEVNGNTELTVEIDVTEEMGDYFATTFPKALAVVKELAESGNYKSITIEATVNAPVDVVWKFWTKPEHITKWNSPSEDWHSPRSENDLRKGGSFVTRMEAKDGSFGFDFGGVYDEVKTDEKIAYTMSDGRKVNVDFTPTAGGTKVVETFDAETMHPLEFQRLGWQAILNNFKKYTESNN